MWKDVYTDFTDLPKHEQQKLFNFIKEEFFSDEEEEMKDAFIAIREARFNEGLACVNCGSVKVKRNGKYKSTFIHKDDFPYDIRNLLTSSYKRASSLAT